MTLDYYSIFNIHSTNIIDYLVQKRGTSEDILKKIDRNTILGNWKVLVKANCRS